MESGTTTGMTGATIIIKAGGTEKLKQKITAPAGVQANDLTANQQIIIEATAPAGYKVTGYKLYKSNAVSTANEISITGASFTEAAAGKNATLRFTPNANNGPELDSRYKTIYVVFQLSVDGYKVTFHPYAEKPTSTFYVVAKENTAISRPNWPAAETSLTRYGTPTEPSYNYLSLMNLTGWYTDVDRTTQYDFTKVVTGNMDLYGKMELKSDAKISVALWVSLPLPPTDNINDESANLFFNPTSKKFVPSVQQKVEIPVGKKLGETFTNLNLPGTISKDNLDSTGDIIVFPKKGYSITGWKLLDLSSGKTTGNAGAAFSADTTITDKWALALLEKYKKQNVPIFATGMSNGTLTFVNNSPKDGEGKALLTESDVPNPINYTVKDVSGLTFDGMEDIEGYKFTENDIQTLKAWVSAKESGPCKDYLFRGWVCTDPSEMIPSEYVGNSWAIESTEEQDASYPKIINDVTLYATWARKYTFKFDLNGHADSQWNAERPIAEGSWPDEAGNEDILSILTGEAEAMPTTDGYEFAGWYADANCTTPVLDDTNDWYNWFCDTAASSGGVDKNITVYAKWVPITATIDVTFQYYAPDDIERKNPKNLQTVSGVNVAEGIAFGDNLPTLPADSDGEKRSFKYTKWTFEGVADAEGNAANYTLDKDTVLYGKLSTSSLTAKKLVVTADADAYITIQFDANEGTDAPAAETTKVGTAITAPTNFPSRYGYTFTGWYADSTTTGETVNFTDSNTWTENKTLYAGWQALPTKDVEIIVTDDSETSVRVENPTIVIKDPNGNEVNPNASGKYVLMQTVSYSISISATGYKTVTDHIDVTADTPASISYRLTPFVAVTDITLALDKVMKTKEYTLADYVTITPETATKKTIVWSAAETLPAGVTLAGGKLTISADAAENAQFKLRATIENGALNADGKTEQDYTKDFTLTVTKYLATITFAHGTGDHPDIELPPKTTVNEDTTLTAPDDPTDDNWTFKGWFKDAACSDGQAWDAKDTFAADATLYAKWEQKAIKVTLTFNGGDGTTKNSNVDNTLTLDSGTTIKLPPCMFTKEGNIFSAWQQDGESGSIVADTSYKVPRKDVTFTAKWTEIATDTSVALIEQSIKGITEDNASKYQPQLFAARDAAHTNPDAGKNTDLRSVLENLFLKSGIAKPTVNGNAATNAAQSGAILSSNGQTVTLTIDKGTAATLPSAYQNAEYKSAWRTITMKHGTAALTEPLVPVLVTMPVPDELSGMAADTIRVLVYGSSAEPEVMEPTVTEDGKLTFSVETLGQYALVGKAISDAADTRVTALVMKYNDKVMGNVKQDDNGNFTVTFPSSMNQTAIDDLLLGTNWKTYLTVAPQAKVATTENPEGWDAKYWAETGVALQFDLSGSSASDTVTLTAIAQNGTKRTFTITAKKITDADRNYKISVSNINGGTVTATPSPAAAGEEVKLTVTPNDGKKLVAGSLSYCLQSAGAKSVPIDESSLTFIMPAGDININAQFEDDANAPLKNPPQITAFVVNGVSAVINSDTKAITIILPYGTDLKHVAPTIVTANASKVEPSSAQRVDLSTPKAYRVYASNGAYVTYTVTAYTEEPSPTQSLWEKLQNQINSNPNWWELAEYQKKTGYYK